MVGTDLPEVLGGVGPGHADLVLHEGLVLVLFRAELLDLGVEDDELLAELLLLQLLFAGQLLQVGGKKVQPPLQVFVGLDQRVCLFQGLPLFVYHHHLWGVILVFKEVFNLAGDLEELLEFFKFDLVAALHGLDLVAQVKVLLVQVLDEQVHGELRGTTSVLLVLAAYLGRRAYWLSIY